MSDCCTPRGYRWVFSERNARAEAKRYRRKGLDSTSRRIVDLLVERGVKDRTVLEVGGGIGAIQIELLKAGAARAVSIELTPTYEVPAAELLAELGMTDRVERRVMDFVTAGTDLPPADIVVMNRVVCCYPDMPRLAAAAADHTRGILVMSFPKRSWWTRLLLGIGNLALRATRRGFHLFLHRPAAIRQVIEGRGLALKADRPGVLWQVAMMERPSG